MVIVFQIYKKTDIKVSCPVQFSLIPWYFSLILFTIVWVLRVVLRYTTSRYEWYYETLGGTTRHYEVLSVILRGTTSGTKSGTTSHYEALQDSMRGFARYLPWHYKNDQVIKDAIIECGWISKNTAQKMKFSVKNFCSKCDQIHRKLRIWSHLLKISLMENFIFCAVELLLFVNWK